MLGKKLFGSIMILLILTICIGAVTAEENNTQMLEDAAPIDEKSFEDIQTAIDNAEENDTIELEGTYTSHGKEIQINKSITLTSKNGATLNAKKNSTIFNISNVSVTIKNLNFINSNSSFTPAILTVGNLTIMDSKFENNTVFIPYDGKAPYDDDDTPATAGAISSTGNLKIINSSFINNNALRQMFEYEHEFDYYEIPWGGAIYSTRNLIIDRTYFENCIIQSNNNLNITNSKFKSSTVIGDGNDTISNSTFEKSENTVISVYGNLTLNHCNFTDNGGYVITTNDGGANTHLIIINACNFKNNNIISAGLYDDIDYETIYLMCCDLYVYNSDFANNTMGAINIESGNLYVENSTFTNNSNTIGGAIFTNGGNATVLKSTFADNYADCGGAIFSERLILENSTFTNNQEGAINSNKFISIDGVNHTGLNNFNNALKISPLFKMTVTNKFTTTYKSGKALQVKIVYSETNNPYSYGFEIKLINGKKISYLDSGYSSKGIYSIKVSGLAAGTYKAIINPKDLDLPTKVITVKINKAPTTVKAAKVTYKFKKSKYFKVTVKAYKKPVKNLKLKVKVYTGKKYKTYTIKTNKNGMAKLNTRNLKVGTHKVVISSGNANYKVSAKSTIKIKK